MFFGRKKLGETVLIVDVESASVSAALVSVPYKNNYTKNPRVFAETRICLPILATHNAALLAKKIEIAAREALQSVSTIAVRFRHAKVRPSQLLKSDFTNFGEVVRVEIFLHAPWVGLKMSASGAKAEAPLTFISVLRALVGQNFGDIPVNFHAFGVAMAQTACTIFPYQQDILIGAVTGELTEFVRVEQRRIMARATVPFGEHSLLRTLQSHAGLSEAEARSALYVPESLLHAEALTAASSHFAEMFTDILRKTGGKNIKTVVFGRKLATPWFARSINASTFAPHQVSALVFAHPDESDQFLLPEALFVADL